MANSTDERLGGERDRLIGVGMADLVFDVPHHRMINASFCHPHPLGSRFGTPDRGSWYAAFDIETSQAEIAFHIRVRLADSQRLVHTAIYDDYLADFSAELHDLRDPMTEEEFNAAEAASQDFAFVNCLDPGSYVESQGLALELLNAGSLGIVYPSVRHLPGTCIACFRPALVGNVRRAKAYRFTWDGDDEPVIEEVDE